MYKRSSAAQEKGEPELLKLQGISIHKNKKCDTWYTRFRNNGQQIYISGKTQRQCYEKLKTKLGIIKKEKQSKDYILQTWYDKWLEIFKIGKIAESTLYSYKQLFNTYVEERYKNKRINAFTPLDIENIINKIPFERQKQRVYELLKDIFGKALKYKITKENVVDIIEKPKHIAKKGTALTIEQQTKFIDVCKDDKKYGYLFLVILYQGLRKGEALALTTKDIEFNKKLLNIDKSFKGNNKDTKTKNTSSIRTIPLFDNTNIILREIKKDNETERLFNYTKQKADMKFKELLEKANLSKSIRIQDLRHTFITNLKNINIPEHIIQAIVGHTIGSKVTSNTYTHIQKDILENNANIINKFYSNSTQKKED